MLRLRVDVFVVEQNCPYPELDGLDLDALHIVRGDRTEQWRRMPRLFPPHADGVPHIGRVVVAMEQRRNHVGKRLMEVTLDALEQQYGSKRSALAAQAHLKSFTRI